MANENNILNFVQKFFDTVYRYKRYINYLIYLLCSSCTHDITWDEYKVEKPSCGRIDTFDISLMGEEIRVCWDPDHTIVICLRKIDSCSNTEEASNDDRDKNSLPWVCAHKNSNPESKNIKIIANHFLLYFYFKLY